MPVFISRKQSLLILLGGLCAAAVVALLLRYLLGGPRLGPAYDFLRDRRTAPPVSREIVLVDTDELAEGSDVFTVLMSLSEFDAGGLVIAVPVLGSSTGRIVSDEEIRRRFGDEYTLLGRNIRNLFEAIRVGSVPPGETSAYVENLVELAEQGRDRLTAALVHEEGAGAAPAARASAVFGAALEAADLRSRPAVDSPWYARPRPDRDGRLRRIAPLLAAPEDGVEAAEAEPGAEQTVPEKAAPYIEHIVFRLLKPRWAETVVEHTEGGPELVLRDQGGGETRIPLDRDGNILIEKPRKEASFRRLALERFREYEEADHAMGLLLREAEALGAYSQTMPERIPLILRDYAAGLREELLEAPDPVKRGAWIAARAEYFAGLEELLYGPAEMIIVGGFEEIIATETLKDEGLAKLQTLRDELIRVFVAMREQHRQLLEIRGLLAETLAASLCVMGSPSAGETGPVESSALLANALLTGCHITPGQDRYILFWSLAAALVLLLCIHALRPLAVLIAGCAAALLSAAGFGWSFIISGYWIDPGIPAASVLAGTAVMFTARFALSRRGARRFRLAYGPAVSKACLRELVRAGRPLLSDINTVPAAVIAVKAPPRQNPETPLETARAAAEFRGAVSLAFKQAGAVITGYEGDTVLACFGSPPERIWLERSAAEKRYGNGYQVSGDHPVIRAAGFITDLLRQAPARQPGRSGAGGSSPLDWRFGVDCGECAFSWSEETGYTAHGRPAAQARILASLASRCHVRALVTGSVREKLRQPVRKINAGGNIEALYELLVSGV